MLIYADILAERTGPEDIDLDLVAKIVREILIFAEVLVVVLKISHLRVEIGF